MPYASRSRYRARRVTVLALVLIVVAVLVIVLTGGSSPTNGYDISYPQCSGSYPSSPLFGVVGVNGGFANNANPCISEELGWLAARRDRSDRGKRPCRCTSTPAILAVTTLGTGLVSGTAPAYGGCNGLLTNSCSYIYGEQRSAYSYRIVAALDPHAARTAPWWLDVELALSWAGTYQLNVAALQGFIAGLQNAGATGPIGVYSTSAQWREITGLTAQTNTDGLQRPAARLGGRDRGDARPGAAELHERYVHRRKADARSVPDRRVRCDLRCPD